MTPTASASSVLIRTKSKTSKHYKDRRHKMKLVEILNAANSQYPDGYLSTYFNQKTGEYLEASGDTLAEFIVHEIMETFDPNTKDVDQIMAAEAAIQTGINDMNEALIGIRSLYKKSKTTRRRHVSRIRKKIQSTKSERR